MSSNSFALFPPNSSSLPSPIPYASLLGSWHVIASTLPLWKNKKNVTITYTPLPGAPATTFDDLVSYNHRSDTPGKSPSTVKGIDRLEVGAGASWKWRGKGLLMIATSQWQLLGFNLSPPAPTLLTDPPTSAEPEWVVTYFASTLFTPAGLDIYARGKDGVSDAFVEELVRGIEGLGGEVKGLVAKGGMFRVPHD